ncbi:MAG: hypothetical protein AAF658_00860 [Myxococcota bacterium]
MSKNIQRLVSLRQKMEDDAVATLSRARSAAESCRTGMAALSQMRSESESIQVATARYCDELAEAARVTLARHESETAAAEAVVFARRKDRKQMEQLLARAEERAAKLAARSEQASLDEWTAAQWHRGGQ